MTDLTNSQNSNGVTPPADGVTPPVTPPANTAPPAGEPPVDGVTPPAGDPPAASGDDEKLSSALGGEGGDDAGDPPAGDPPAAVVPEAYDVGTVEGFDVDPAALEEATPIFKEAGLTNEQATKLMPAAQKFAERTQSAVMQGLVDAATQQRNAWLNDAKTAEDIGGAKFNETLHVAAKGMDAMGFVKGHPFRAVLTETGFGNHPDMIRVFQKLGSLVGEDSAVRGNPMPTSGKRDQVSTWYPKDEEK